MRTLLALLAILIPAPAAFASDLHVVGFGDSVTAGYCASPGRDYFSLLIDNDDAAYPGYTGRDLDSHFTTVTASNYAISGSTSCDYSSSELLWWLSWDPDLQSPGILVITLGGNDLLHNYGHTPPAECAAFGASYDEARGWAKRFQERMISFINVYKSLAPAPHHIFIANIYDPTDGVGDIHNAPVSLPAWDDGLDVLALYNETLDTIAAETGATLIDLHSEMLGHGIHYDDPATPSYDTYDPSYWYCSNLEDPNDTGYHHIREAFWKQIAIELQLE